MLNISWEDQGSHHDDLSVSVYDFRPYVNELTQNKIIVIKSKGVCIFMWYAEYTHSIGASLSGIAIAEMK